MMVYVVVMFIALVISGTVIVSAWITAVHPPDPDEVPLTSLDGHALCPGCKHPMVASHTVRRVTTTEELFR